MYLLLKWVSVLLFLATPAAAIAGVWYSDWRFLWIMLITLLFSAFTNGFADSLKKQKLETATNSSYKNIDATRKPDELIDFDDTSWEWITKFGNKTDQ